MKVYTGKLGQKQRIRIGSKISDSLIEQCLEDDYLEKHVMDPYVFVYASKSNGAWSFRYFIISRQQFIKLARAGHDWYVNGYKREKPVSQKSPAGFNLTWLKGEGEDANNHRIAFQNPLKGVN